MSTLVLYYSLTGTTGALAKAYANANGCDINEIIPLHPVRTAGAYVRGCPAALLGNAWPIHLLESDYRSYDKIIIFTPVWAGRVPPYVGAFLCLPLEETQTVYFKLVSGSGVSNCAEKLHKSVEARGGTWGGYEDILALKS